MGTLALLNTFLHKSITKIPNENLDFQVYTHKIGKSEISHHFTRVHSMDVMKSTNTLVIMQRTRIRVMDLHSSASVGNVAICEYILAH